MNPEHGQMPIDYLNKISPDQQKPAPFRLTLRTVIFAAIAVVVIVIIASVIASTIADNRKTPWEQLSARLVVTSTIANDATTTIKNSQLRSLNSDLKIYITNTTRDLSTPLTKVGVENKKIPAAITTKENSTGITGRLEDARLNAKFDSTYAREMSYQLATILSLYQKLYASSSSATTKAFLLTSYNNLLPTQKAIADFSASTE